MFEDSCFEQLPGGKCYQKGGYRLEQASYNCLPYEIKENTLTNLKPKKANGDIIVEYDMIYSKGNEIISFEIKGLNNRTSQSLERQERLLNQAIRQKTFLMDNFKDRKDIKIVVIFCLVKGKKDDIIDVNFINKFKEHNIMIAIGSSPNDTIKNAIKVLKEAGFLSSSETKSIEIKNIDSKNTDKKIDTILVGSPDKVSYIDKLIQKKNQ
jgi:hypothetical protein